MDENDTFLALLRPPVTDVDAAMLELVGLKDCDPLDCEIELLGIQYAKPVQHILKLMYWDARQYFAQSHITWIDSESLVQIKLNGKIIL